MTVMTEPTSEVHRHALVRTASAAPRATRLTTFGADHRIVRCGAWTAPRDTSIARIDDMLSRSDIVKLSDDDLTWLRPGDRPGDAIRWLMSRGPAILIVTHRDTAATGYIRGGSVRVRGHRAAVTDRAEWEDAFVAGLLQALRTRDLLDRGADRSLRSVGLDDLRGILHDANVHAAQAITSAVAR